MFKRLLSAFFSFALLGTASGISSAGVTVPDVLKDRIALKKTAQQLNVVYFLGSDTEPVPDYERRLSELLLYLQQFYGREMQRHGYGARSFGLDIKSPGRVNIIEYKAKNPAAHYPYENGGGWKAAQELDEFFKANPDRKKSQHTLVIMPTWNDEKNGPDNPGGVPFYGMGRNCFALDYPAFDIKHLGQKTREGQLLTKWYGGLAHELGHGLNLPHNHQTASDGKKYGTALMGAGNYTFGTSPTFLTPASCALLDACEVFSVTPAQKFYEGRPEVEIKDTAISFKGDQILISGSYKSPQTVKALNVYVQDPPYAVNQDYDAVSFSQRLGKKSGKFSMKIDKKELDGLTNNEFRISLMFILANGLHMQKHFTFHWDALQDYRDEPKS
ncbi:hypothetical protein CXU10_08690 [Akkermansia muciniphila]|jgi:hypothetical protein|uniref:hypothetical protein n=1 Tax=Akkermansia muciniphila TaxID=239935 RepID=UPI000C9B843F|nr:hypothetical protein [Akkermansia muciniphila]PNC36997.1 hypothetical protein CXU10_08690 [Akkermansia muciniphila]